MKLVHDSINARVLLEDDTRNAFYTDELTCPHSVVDEVVSIYNTTQDIMQVDLYLLDEEKCTTEDREIIIEGINNLE